MDYWGWKPYVSVAERRRKAAREMAQRKKQGYAVAPVTIEGYADGNPKVRFSHDLARK